MTAELAKRSRAVQDRFQKIGALLALNPHPNPQLPMLTEDWTADGSKIYTYSDDTFPYAVHYVMVEPTDDLYGLVLIVDLSPMNR